MYSRKDIKERPKNQGNIRIYNVDHERLIGLREALFLRQLHYWLNSKSGRHINGRKWIFNTFQDWRDTKNFPNWSESTLKRIVKKLKDLGIYG